MDSGVVTREGGKVWVEGELLPLNYVDSYFSGSSLCGRVSFNVKVCK